MKVCFLYGPTASGKTELAIQMVEKFGGEIINCDSIAVYQHVNIGTAKPDASELERAKHHLVSFVDHPKQYTAADFMRDATGILEDCESRKVPLVVIVGGTGFYFQALELGLPEAISVDAELSEKVKKEGESSLEKLFDELKSGDPEYAKKIHFNDQYRITRAVELLRSGHLPSEAFVKRSSQFKYPLFKVFLNPDRGLLRERVTKRAKKMLSMGLIEEVEKLLKQGLEPSWAPLQSVGYKEVFSYLNKEISLSEMEDLIITHSMQLAKRQRTWFRKDLEALEVTSLEEQKESLFEKLKDFIAT